MSCFKIGTITICEMMREGKAQVSLPRIKGRSQSRTRKPDSCVPCLSSPFPGPSLPTLPLQDVVIHAFKSCLVVVISRSTNQFIATLGSICFPSVSREARLPQVKDPSPMTPQIQWYLQLPTQPIDKTQPSKTSLECF